LQEEIALMQDNITLKEKEVENLKTKKTLVEVNDNTDDDLVEMEESDIEYLAEDPNNNKLLLMPDTTTQNEIL